MHLQKLKINPLLVFINILAKGIFKCFPFKLKLELGRAGEIKLNSCLACTQGWCRCSVRWWEMWRRGWTTLDRFANFMQVVLDDLAANPQTAGQSFVFTIDNLNVYKKL